MDRPICFLQQLHLSLAWLANTYSFVFHCPRQHTHVAIVRQEEFLKILFKNFLTYVLLSELHPVFSFFVPIPLLFYSCSLFVACPSPVSESSTLSLSLCELAFLLLLRVLLTSPLLISLHQPHCSPHLAALLFSKEASTWLFFPFLTTLTLSFLHKSRVFLFGLRILPHSLQAPTLHSFPPSFRFQAQHLHSLSSTMGCSHLDFRQPCMKTSNTSYSAKNLLKRI